MGGDSFKVQLILLSACHCILLLFIVMQIDLSSMSRKPSKDFFLFTQQGRKVIQSFRTVSLLRQDSLKAKDSQHATGLKNKNDKHATFWNKWVQNGFFEAYVRVWSRFSLLRLLILLLLLMKAEILDTSTPLKLFRISEKGQTFAPF